MKATGNFQFPLLKRELVGLLRTRRAFWLLVLSVAASSLFPLLAWPRSGRAFGYSYENLAMFLTFSLTQLTVAILIIPAFTAGAISGERERNTYELLYTTLLSPLSIIVSKVLASTGYVFLLLAATAPSVCVLYLLGGISFETVLKCYGITFGAVLTTGLVCLTVSMRSKRTAHAVVRGMIWAVVWNGGLLLLLFLVLWVIWEAIDFRGNPPEQILLGLLSLSPHYAIGLEIFIDEIPLQVRAMPLGPCSFFLLYAGTLSAFHLLYLLRKVRTPDLSPSRRRERRLLWRLGGKGPRRVRRALLTRAIVRLGEWGLPLLRNPVFLKEIRSEFFGRPWYRRVVFWLPLGMFVLVMFLDFRFREYVVVTGLVAMGLLTLLIPGVVASSFPREREQGNLDLLRGTLVPLRSVLFGKFLAGLFSAWGVFAAAAIVPVLALILGWWQGRSNDVTYWNYLVFFTVIPLACVFAAAVAMFFSVISRKTLGALISSYIALLILFLGLPIFVNLAFSWSDLRPYEKLLYASNPFVTLAMCLERDPRDKEVDVLTSYYILHGLGTILLWLLSSLFLQSRWVRDR